MHSIKKKNASQKQRISISAFLLNTLEQPAIASAALWVAQLPHTYRRIILVLGDISLSTVSIYVVLAVRINADTVSSLNETYSSAIFLTVFIREFSFYVFGLYRHLLRYFSTSILRHTLKSILFSEVACQVIFAVVSLAYLPRSVRLTSGLLYVLLIFLSRLTIAQVLAVSDNRAIATLSEPLLPNSSTQQRSSVPVVIYGAGAAGFILQHLLASEPQYQIVAFLDDNSTFHGRTIAGIPIYDPDSLIRLARQQHVQEVFIAMPSASTARRRQIVQRLQNLSLSIKTVPSVAEIVSGQFSLKQVRTIDITDLLGREEVLPYPKLLQADITDKVVLVTGAGGSIGSELCRQIAQQKPSGIILYELNEFALYSIDLEIAEAHPSLKRIACLGSVTDSERLEAIMRDHQVETVYHAAAYKHVPLVEANPAQGLLNNTYGTWKAAQSAIAAGVETFVLISTDKAVRPTNVMGASKRAAELVLQALAARRDIETRFAMVRFGNVLDSSGSVVPRFRKQIAQHQPITVTHQDITRYFMSIPEAARLVIQAGAMARGGEVFLLDMGEPIKIYDLAVQMIELSGLKVNEDIPIQITGLRPGEKLYEELLIDGDTAMPSQHPKIYCANEAMLPWPELESQLHQLISAAQKQQQRRVVELLQILVPEYKPRRTLAEGKTGKAAQLIAQK